MSAHFDVPALRAQFPALHQSVNGRPLIYLDNAATSHKPLAVLTAMDAFYRRDNANVHRAAHTLSARATEAFEAARGTVARFVNAARPEEIIWTRGTTEAINLVANSWGASLGPGDEILLSTLEHHANIVPWQLLAQRQGVQIKVIPLTTTGELDLAAALALLSPRTRLLAVSQVSNVLGTVTPLARLIAAAKSEGALTLVDGAQAAGHLPVDVQALGCDFYAFSGHKLYGPTGIGVLYGRHDLLEQMPPWQGGGEMIRKVSFAGTRFNAPPFRFEAGTPPIAEAIGLAAALDFLTNLPDGWRQHEADLLAQLCDGLDALPFVRRIGRPSEQVGVVSVTFDDWHPQDAGELLDQMGIACRVGHHCAMPLMEALGLDGTLRFAPALYNTREEIAATLAALARLPEFF
ncbi:cysteine desulfurase [Pseudaeromonas paramecii]|uniref:Cysteine desulfurase n=1 Tax=Pseudaeromonas paramecii TaxID=2138166 RepID=A0ABP8PXI4_9GAMM